VLLSELTTPDRTVALAEEAMALARDLYPFCRSITGDGVRSSLARLHDVIDLECLEVPSGTTAFDWEVPPEWNIREAWIRDPAGRTVVDFRNHSLHVVSYSVPVRRRMPLPELLPHLHSLPEHPDWIPYRTSYYKEAWGFCLRHADLVRLEDVEYEVCIDSTLAPGHLSYGEYFVPGQIADEVLIYTHICHPSLANDNLTGITLTALLARAIAAERPRLSYRFIFAPGTIGSLVWLARNEAGLRRVRHGLVLGLLGDAGRLTYKESRSGTAVVDRAGRLIVGEPALHGRVMPFEPYGYDERQFCSPGFDLPVGRLTRSPNGTYPEYHTSADDLEFIRVPFMSEALATIARMVGVLDSNRRCVNLSPKGEPRLGKRGLYGSIGGLAPAAFQQALLWVLNQSDGEHDLLAIAARSGLEYALIERAASALETAGLVAAHP
jgi:aminopeptidase-like protein